MPKPTETQTQPQQTAKPRLSKVERARLALEKAERQAAESAKRKADRKAARAAFREAVTDAMSNFRAGDWGSCSVSLMAAVNLLNDVRDDEAGQ